MAVIFVKDKFGPIQPRDNIDIQNTLKNIRLLGAKRKHRSSLLYFFQLKTIFYDFI